MSLQLPDMTKSFKYSVNYYLHNKTLHEGEKMSKETNKIELYIP